MHQTPRTKWWRIAAANFLAVVVALGAVSLATAILTPRGQAHPTSAQSAQCLTITSNEFAMVLGGDATSVSSGPILGPEPSDYGRFDCQMSSNPTLTTIEVAIWFDPTGDKFAQLQSWAIAPPESIVSDAITQIICYGVTQPDEMFGTITSYSCDMHRNGQTLEIQDFDSVPRLNEEQVIALLRFSQARM